MDTNKMTGRILSRKEAAEYLGVGDKTLDRICARYAGLRRIQLAERRVGFAESDLDAYIAAVTKPKQEAAA